MILTNIRKNHINDIESMDYTKDSYESLKDVVNAIKFGINYIDKFVEYFCKSFQIKYKRVSDDEKTVLKKFFNKSPLIKNSGIKFRKKRK